MYDYIHLKLYDQFIVLIDMKLHAPNQLYTSICFRDKILKTSLGLPGNVWPHHLNLHNLFITLIDMKLHAQNQLYMSFCFWDLKVLIVSLWMFDHAQLKSHQQWVALIDVYIQTKNPLHNSDSFWDIKV